jgi:hypothetical protein
VSAVRVAEIEEVFPNGFGRLESNVSPDEGECCVRAGSLSHTMFLSDGSENLTPSQIVNLIFQQVIVDN